MAGSIGSRWSSARLVALAIPLCWLVLTATAWNMRAPAAQRPPLALIPDDPSNTLDRAMELLRSSNGAAMPRVLAMADRAARLDPLDGRPLFLHAFDETVRSRSSADTIPLLEAAQHRDPRLAEARMLLLDAYGRHGRPEDAVREARPIMSLVPGQKEIIVRLIAGLAGLEGGEQALAGALPDSTVKGDVLLRLAATGAESEVIERLVAPMQGIGKNQAERRWISSLTARIAQRPDPGAARLIWAALYDLDPNDVGTQVADPNFDDGGSPPFGWQFNTRKGGLAELRDGALEVYYYGRTNATFASQLLTLPPGRYQIASRVSSNASEGLGALSWQVTCRSGDALASARLSTLMQSPGAAETYFTVPANRCEAQDLQLVGRPSAETNAPSLRIERVTVGPAPA